MAHAWFKDVDWDRLRRKQVNSPFAAVYNAEQYQDQLNNIHEVPIPAETVLLLKKEAIQSKEYQLFRPLYRVCLRWEASGQPFA